MPVRKTVAAALAAIPCVSALLLAGLMAGISPTPAHAQTPQQYFFYKLGVHDLSIEDALAVGKGMDLVPAVQAPARSYAFGSVAPVITFADANGLVRMIYFENTGQFKYFPDLTQISGPAPSPKQADIDATAFFTQKGLLPFVGRLNGGFAISEIEATGTQSWQAPTPGGPSGGPINQPHDVMQTVNYYLNLDGLRVVGPGYSLSADVSSNGVQGFSRHFRYLIKQDTQFQIITQEEATIKFNSQFEAVLKALRTGDPKTTAKIVYTDLIYYEQGETFLQPAYRFQVVLTSSNGIQSFEDWYIPAASKTPEPIINLPLPTFGANPALPPGSSTTASSQFKNGPTAPVHVASSMAPPGSKGKVYDPLDFAVYVLRDDARFLPGANGFIANLQQSNLIANAFMFAGFPQTVLNQYYWDYPWLWENDPQDNVPDNSPFFVGENNLVLYEGHGAPWSGTTYSNCCDTINYTTFPGYGAFHGGESTNYIIFHTCDSMPAPGDPYGFNYQSPAGPFDVWFNTFQGMRGAYGSRTAVYIADGVEPSYAASAGLGVPNLEAWFNAESNDSGGHGSSDNIDYACAVIISGHENDTIYDTGAVAPPGSLTMYWQH